MPATPLPSYRVFLAALPAALTLLVSKAAPAEEIPAIDKTTLVISAVKVTEEYTKPKLEYVSTWRPRMKYLIRGPIASGSQIYVEYTLPGGTKWLHYNCFSSELAAGKPRDVECGTEDVVLDTKKIVPAGPVDFTIRMRNELQGLNAALFSGKIKVIKYSTTPKATEADYVVDEDWRIPIGYVAFDRNIGFGSDDYLHVGFWYRGNSADVEAHLFYQGKDIAKCGRGGNGEANWRTNIYQWSAFNCGFEGVYGELPADGTANPPKFALHDNPGDYEIKVLIVGHLARSLKFNVKPGGGFDNGIASANKLGTDRVIVPVQILGNPGNWDHSAWKTGAFYGNPLSGFTAGP
jgi:hypothetical protein